MMSSGEDFETASDEELMTEIDSVLGSSPSRVVMDEAAMIPAAYDPEVPETHGLLSDDEDDVFTLDRYTVEDAVENMGFGWFQVKVFFICGLFAATDALEMLLLSFLAPMLRCDWQLEQHQVAFITTVVFVGMFSGSSMWGSFADKYGRWPIMFICACWILYQGILTAFSPNYPWIIILRGLVGFGFGGAVQSFTLQSEYMPSKYRAKILIISNVNWALGSCFEVLMASYILPTYGWRYLVGVSALPMLLTILTLWTLPDSARYLVAAGKREKAEEVLRKASKSNGKTLPKGRLVYIKETSRGNIWDMFRNGYARTTIQLWIVWFVAAFSYYGIVLLSTEILEKHAACGAVESNEENNKCNCELLSSKDYTTMLLSTLGEFASIPLNLLTIDWLGRRITIVLNLFLASLCFLLLQLCTNRFWLTVIIFGIRAAAAGNFNTIYIYTTEVYPTTIRSIGLGCCSAMARVGAMLTPFIATVMLDASYLMTVWIYGIVCFLAGLSACLLPIETLGRSLKQSTKS